jgi:hypothetical protein
MKKILIAILFLFICIESIAFDFSLTTPSGQVLFYDINESTSTVMVTAPVHSKVKSSYVGYTKPSGNLIIPNEVINNGINYVVTAIDNNAFGNCTELETVVIPDNVVIIGDEAFLNCNNLRVVKLGKNIKKIGSSAFLSCTKLQQINLPNTLTEISKHAFANCSSLEKIVIPDNIKNIEPYTFYSCEKLKEIILPSSIEYVGEAAFAFCRNIVSLSFSNKLKIVEDKAFSSCVQLKNVNLPDSLISLGSFAFSTCSSLQSIEIPSLIREINNSTFLYCKNLENVVLPNDLREIHNNAFEYCTKLKTIKIPSSITAIGNATFANCVNLDSVHLPSSVNLIGSYAFRNCTNLKAINLESVQHIDKYAFEQCKNLEKIILSNAREIREYAFSECTKLKTVEIPNTIDTIRNYVFYSCSGIEKLSIGNNVKSIGNYAFYKCMKLDSLEFPSATTTIGIAAFEKCTNLSSITFGENLLTISDYAFNNCKKLKSIAFKSIYPPKVFKNTWKNSSKDLVISLPLGSDENYVSFLGIEKMIPEIKKEIVATPIVSATRMEINLTKINSIDLFSENIIEESYQYTKGLSKLPQKRKILCLDYPQLISTLTTSLYAFNSQPIEFENLVVSKTEQPIIIEQQMEYPEILVVKEEPKKEIKKVSVRILSEDYLKGEVKGGGEFNVGEEILISAIEKEGYKFVSWNDNNLDNPRTLQIVSDTALYAIFEAETLMIDVQSNDFVMGETYGSGLYEYNSEVIITADAFDGYQFVKWNDGNTENPRTIKVNEEKTIYIAIFSPRGNFGISDKLTFYPNPTKGPVYLSKKAKMIEVFNTSGNLVEIFVDKSVVDISYLPEGTYTFRVTVNEGIQTLKVVLKK